MSNVPYLDAGKFEKVGENFFKLSQAVMFLSKNELSAEQRQEEYALAIGALKDLGFQFSSILKEFDKRIVQVEHSK